jgi:acyl carrier protein
VKRIDLLKVDVEKSEMDVLAGLESEDWAGIMQVVVEVHDLDGRLAQITSLLESHGFTLEVEQDGSLADSTLYNVYAVRPGYEPTSMAEPAAEPSFRGPEQLRRSLLDFLRAKLPEYMVPASFVLLDELPLTSSGKVDRRALPAATGQEPGRGFVLPRNPAEEKLAAIWQAVLGSGRTPGVHDSFFDLGGHSLLATQVLSRIRDAFGTELSLRAFFAAPTVAGLAVAVSRQAEESTAPPLAPRISRQSEDESIPENLDSLSDDQVNELLRVLLADGGETR